MAQMSEKDFLKSVSDIGVVIASLADAYRKLNSGHNTSFGEACGMVIGMALDAYSDHDNSADILQAATILKAYAQMTKKAQTKKYMIQ